MSEFGFTAWLAEPALQSIAHAAMAALFARSAWHKWRDSEGFRRALAAYGLVRDGFSGVLARVFAISETTIAVSLLVPDLGPVPALAGATLLALYTAAMVAAWLAGRREIDCGCGPPGSEQPIGPVLWLRNSVLVALLGVAAMPAAATTASTSGLGVLGWAQVAAATAMACLVYAAADRALANAHRAGAMALSGRLS